MSRRDGAAFTEQFVDAFMDDGAPQDAALFALSEPMVDWQMVLSPAARAYERLSPADWSDAEPPVDEEGVSLLVGHAEARDRLLRRG